MSRYRRAKHAIVSWTARVLFELAAVQIVVGVLLWPAAYLVSPDEPPIVLAMSALALIFSGWVGMGVAADADPDAGTEGNPT